MSEPKPSDTLTDKAFEYFKIQLEDVKYPPRFVAGNEGIQSYIDEVNLYYQTQAKVAEHMLVGLQGKGSFARYEFEGLIHHAIEATKALDEKYNSAFMNEQIRGNINKALPLTFENSWAWQSGNVAMDAHVKKTLEQRAKWFGSDEANAQNVVNNWLLALRIEDGNRRRVGRKEIPTDRVLSAIIDMFGTQSKELIDRRFDSENRANAAIEYRQGRSVQLHQDGEQRSRYYKSIVEKTMEELSLSPHILERSRGY